MRRHRDKRGFTAVDAFELLLHSLHFIGNVRHARFHFVTRHHAQAIGIHGDDRGEQIDRLLFGQGFVRHLNGQRDHSVDDERYVIQSFFEIRFGGRFCPIEQDRIHPGWVACRHRLFEQVEKTVQLLFEPGAHIHAARKVAPYVLDPLRADFSQYFLNGHTGRFFLRHPQFTLSLALYQFCGF